MTGGGVTSRCVPREVRVSQPDHANPERDRERHARREQHEQAFQAVQRRRRVESSVAKRLQNGVCLCRFRVLPGGGAGRPRLSASRMIDIASNE